MQPGFSRVQIRAGAYRVPLKGSLKGSIENSGFRKFGVLGCLNKHIYCIVQAFRSSYKGFA